MTAPGEGPRSDADDAQRYRFLRERLTLIGVNGTVLTPEQMDMQLDAFIKAEQMGEAQGTA